MRRICNVLVICCFCGINAIWAQSYMPKTLLSLAITDSQTQTPETLQNLASQFVSPPDSYEPLVFWHWLGANYSKMGITKDLEAMKRVGINGAVLFNAPAWIDTTRNPWPQQTYRSEYYWDALKHALTEAKRLKMTIGLHNSPGWSTTGGPWVEPEKDGMKAVAFSTTKIEGGKKLSIELSLPKGDYYKDVAVWAVPKGKTLSVHNLVDISKYFSNDILNWDAPAGEWTVYRFGYYSTMQRTHPTPEDVADISFESDKMNPEATRRHWDNVLNPLIERFNEFIGTTFNIIWTDSYEAWGQNWASGFRDEFIKMKGYDPVPQIILAYERGDNILNEDTKGIEYESEKFSLESNIFIRDYAQVVSRLMLNCFRIGKEMINAAGFQYYWEPYGSIIDAPFDMEEGEGIADVPTTEFWVHSRAPSGDERFATAAARYNKRIVAAEAFTGMEATCTFNETPAMLKFPADMAFNYGVNQMVLHSWAHDPLSDEFQPGWNFAHYGTHFIRNQTWIEPVRAFFTYLSRCQMLLQQGSFVSRNDSVLHRSTPEAEIFFVRNTGGKIENKVFRFNIKNRNPELWDAYTGQIVAPKNWDRNGEVALNLEKNESVFVIFPANETGYAKIPEKTVISETEKDISGSWKVTFVPKTNEKPFTKTFEKLVDFSQQADFNIKYFSGTAIYSSTCNIQYSTFKDSKVYLDLGKVCDLAEVEINGKNAGILWNAPFMADITDYLKPGNNTLRIKVTNTWTNRLIGDEQYPADFEWVKSDWNGLPVMNGLPEWATNGRSRPSKERKTFIPWSYFDKNSQLLPAGLLGPVTIKYLRVNSK